MTERGTQKTEGGMLHARMNCRERKLVGISKFGARKMNSKFCEKFCKTLETKIFKTFSKF